MFVRRIGITLRRSGAIPLPRRGTAPQHPRRTGRPEWLGRGEMRQRDLVNRSRRAVRWLQPGLVVKRWMVTSGLSAISLDLVISCLLLPLGVVGSVIFFITLFFIIIFL